MSISLTLTGKPRGAGMPFSGIVLIATAWKEDWTGLTGPIFGSASWLRRSGWEVPLSQVLPHSGALLPICLAVLNTAQRKSGYRILGAWKQPQLTFFSFPTVLLRLGSFLEPLGFGSCCQRPPSQKVISFHSLTDCKLYYIGEGK